MRETDEILKGLTDRLEAVLDRYFPGWVRRGARAYPAPKSGKDLGSFEVILTGARRGKWWRNSEGVGGNPINLLAYAVAGDHKAYRRAFDEARAFLGITKDVLSPRHEEDPARVEARKKRDAEEALKKRRRAETAAGIWERCIPIEETLAERYLVQRGIPRPPDGWPEEIGFHRGLTHEISPDRPVFPCLVGSVANEDGAIEAVWRIYLDPATGLKARVSNPKLGLGSAIGGACRLGGIGPRIGVCEGIETGLAIRWLTGFRFPIWCGLSTSGVAGLDLPDPITSLSIFPDGDAKVRRKDGEYLPEPVPPGLRAARALAERARASGMKVGINTPPDEADYLDAWRSLSMQRPGEHTSWVMQRQPRPPETGVASESMR